MKNIVSEKVLEFFLLWIVCVGLLMSLMASSGCRWGYDDPVTWGDVTTELSEAYCYSLQECRPDLHTEPEKCVSHNVFHFCELNGTCDWPATLEHAEGIDQCTSDIREQSCLLTTNAKLPDSCGIYI